MVQLTVLSGKMAGTEMAARHFPFTIGRSPESNLCLEEDGVWADHLRLAFDPQSGIVLTALENALVTVNGEPVREAVMRNGDLIEIGGAKLRFWLSAPRQYDLRLREALTWACFVLVAAGQVALIYWLLQ
jgi:pSer/pThr/pTyr-binding forkhead associated (FHA) protein